MDCVVSVVIPIYNVEEYVIDMLKSIINQTYKNIELILVDDGSPDNSAQIAENFLKEQDVNWVIIHKKNGGLSAARNTGIERASGKYIICPDSDDVIHPNTIQEMLIFAENNNLNCVFCGYKLVYKEDLFDFDMREGSAGIYTAQKMRKVFLERKIRLLVPGMLLKKEIYDEIQYDPQCPYDEDIHFLWRLLFLEKNYGYVSNKYYHYLSRDNSMVHTLSAKNYLKTSKCYEQMVYELEMRYPQHREFIHKIHPKYRLGGLHVLAKANDYATFKETVYEDGYRKGMSKLVFQSDLKLAIYALIYISSLRLFYLVSR